VTAQAGPPLAGRRILVIEDETLIAMEVEDVLSREGAVIVGTANSVAHGYEVLARTDPEAAVLDLNLDGEVSAPLAAAFTERHVPFVIVSGYGEGWDQHPEFRDAPRLQKPVEYRSLVRLLAGMLAPVA
jgi:DNA-binding NtrC family response regulator